MGIISDFQELNREIKEFENNTSILHLVSKIKCKIQTNKLIKITEKLRISNSPLSKEDLLELAMSIYSNCIPNGTYKNVKVSFYGRSSVYRIFVDINEEFPGYKLISSLIEVSADEKTIHITISTEDLKTETAHRISFAVKDFSTNIKEAKEDTARVNKILINVMADYILDNIRDKNC